ncbi:MAG: UDP-N-acetylglucosamine 1-carboxyvinyltransferase [Anaerolineaceae bacterium]|jgi:UDP-N-acetylglucosamine 1-carboxyvinyltransferase|nr:UDP-N-acetylglucosamine 1-carboxyvinyltransferase [Anaerolineae bacterium]MBV6465211.1 UDP-N-acetylglucosamine 1-carboxyvinyltransferase [Anaerolineales bacterium]MCE7905015.1 UDP-N-acetylglucosamine 1-carboxyvinyltransferase [Anaerolineae bacterium CFX3]MDL1924792.1 UDP-N-acetylglucosamine 1-carboxyvinyltransferase [Anaerolineae bacterium AMX1]GIK08685.1 MAG: UDP-N-acetylglucosamine 1-carboxyvinyltransferase [Chloroflexota bacterium]GJQ39165.1 MAG: UDP-N-acetylglucosamine 1-carboxyvinyltra
MEQFIIEGGHPLRGEVTPGGNKNAALPLLAACLLTEEPVVLRNVPRIRDVSDMRHLIESLGVEVEDLGDNAWRITARTIRPTDLDPGLCRRIRASILLAGPMTARAGELRLSPPGGDVIGRRRLDTHILALRALGAEVNYGRTLEFLARGGLKGADILLDEASVTATENAIMAAARARGVTVIRNAASEPHIQELCRFLNKLGARIENIGSNTLHIEGVERLRGGEFAVGPDYLEVVSLIGAAAVTRGELRIRNAGVNYLEMIAQVFRRLGVTWEVEGDDLLVPANQPLEMVSDLGGVIPEIKTNVWPAFPTDLMSIAITVATQAAGSALFHDWMYSGRMYFTDKLVGMGARIILCDPYRCLVQGPNQLIGENLESPDIRAGMSLLLAALAADGKSVIRNVGQIDRGYERVDAKLRAVGAQIERVKE